MKLKKPNDCHASGRDAAHKAKAAGALAALRRAAEDARRRAAANGTKLAFFKDGKVVLEDPYPEKTAKHKPDAAAQECVEREKSYADGSWTPRISRDRSNRMESTNPNDCHVSGRDAAHKAKAAGALAALRRAAEDARRRAAANGTKLAFFKDGKVVLEDPYPEKTAKHKPNAAAQECVEREKSYASG